MPTTGKARMTRKDTVDSPNTATLDTATPNPLLEGADQYVNQWNRLVSTTNWEKGRIICEWRDALEKDDAPANDFTDEAWAALVGGVTGQHVGRLRRVHQQFGKDWQEYPGLFWSHFQIASEWEDAEMWLEGAVQNGWSVSKMRAARWEAHGAPAELKPSDADIISSEVDEDMVDVPGDSASSDGVSSDASSDDAAIPETASVQDPGSDVEEDAYEEDSSESMASTSRITSEAEEEATKSGPRPRPLANLPELPDDIAEAFEQFKLVILNHKLAGWNEISCDDLLASLDALKELAVLPAE